MRYERQILHRDISKGNVMYVEEATEKTTTGAVDSGSAGAEEVPLCFIKYLLGERYVDTRDRSGDRPGGY